MYFIYISVQSGASIIERFGTRQVSLSNVSRGGASVVVLRGQSFDVTLVCSRLRDSRASAAE